MREPGAKSRVLRMARSVALAQAIDAEKRQCWRNAMLAIMTQENLRHAHYVEGWAIPEHGIPIEHGWLEIEEEASILVLDPTLVLLGDRNVAYFPGLRFSYEEVQAFWNTTLPYVRQDGHGGWSWEPYQRAQERAYLHAFGTLKRVGEGSE